MTVLRGEGARTAQLGGLLDSALALAVAGLLVAEYVSDDTLTRVQVVAGFVVSVVIGVLVMVRRRVPWLLPLAVTLVVALRPVLPAGGDGVAWGLAAMVGAYSVAVYANAAIAWVGLGLTTVSALLVMASDGSSWDLGGFLFYGVWFCGPWGAGWLVRRRRSHEQQLEESVARLGQGREEETRAAVIEERIRIARELHDVVGHALSVMVLQADGGRRLIDSEPDETRDALDTIERVGRDALGEMRRLVALMRETPDADAFLALPAIERLSALVDELGRAGVPVELEVVGEKVVLSPGVDLTLYRTAQEALTNVLKHAGPANATVLVSFGLDHVTVTIADDGHGAQAKPPGSGYGLTGLAERVSLYGGVLFAGDRPGGGYEVRATIPYQAGP